MKANKMDAKMGKNLFQRLTLPALVAMLLNATAIRGDATVVGSVFCDQCLMGKPSIWGSPMHDANVMVDCKNSNNAMQSSHQASTSVLGTFVFKVSGNVDLSSCSARLTGSSSSSCSLFGNAEQSLNLDWKMFGEAFYSVEPMFFKPEKPMSFCPNSSSSSPSPPDVNPKPPSISLPPAPFEDASSCTHDQWAKPEHLCYWKFLSPNETAREAFGPALAQGYGNATLMDALNGKRIDAEWPYRSRAYRGLLRETVTALLNSYSSKFKYSPFTVVAQFTDVISSNSSRAAAKLAHEFQTANSGGKCLLQTCK
ncbi:hypothetical protein O6H91_14G017200 [Diphasiastrum complanatum]|nr:hypothetical protein O6H91_14G017200 [Diphasiastrum complanatum]